VFVSKKAKSREVIPDFCFLIFMQSLNVETGIFDTINFFCIIKVVKNFNIDKIDFIIQNTKFISDIQKRFINI